MHSEIGIDTTAPPRAVFELAHDVSRWPQQLPHYRQVTVHSRNNGHVKATMRAVRPIWRFGLPVWWRAEQWADPSNPDDLQLRFEHYGGATTGMHVTWHIRPTDEGARVTIEHDFRRWLPLLGDQLFPRIVDRLFVRPIAGRTLSTFKRLAEAGS
jgi:ribosome-associated toxin RatA of RatAB toxin-antitoxin module